MTFKGTPPTEATSSQASSTQVSPQPLQSLQPLQSSHVPTFQASNTPQLPHVPSELEIATKWDTCVENTIKSVAIGVAVTLPIFFFARAGWMRGIFLGGGLGYGLGSGVGECRSLFSRPLDTPLVRVRRPITSAPQSTLESTNTTRPNA